MTEVRDEGRRRGSGGGGRGVARLRSSSLLPPSGRPASAQSLRVRARLVRRRAWKRGGRQARGGGEQSTTAAEWRAEAARTRARATLATHRAAPGSGGMPSGKAVGSLPSMRMCCIFWPRRSAEFQWFLDALSVRPGRYLAMSAHLLPNLLCSSSSIRSSSSVHASLRMSWSRWLCQRSRHCLPVRPGKCWATSVQLRVPCTPTRCLTSASSCAVHCLRVVPSFSLSLSGLASSRPSALSDAAGSQANMEPSSASSILGKLYHQQQPRRHGASPVWVTSYYSIHFIPVQGCNYADNKAKAEQAAWPCSFAHEYTVTSCAGARPYRGAAAQHVILGRPGWSLVYRCVPHGGPSSNHFAAARTVACAMCPWRIPTHGSCVRTHDTIIHTTSACRHHAWTTDAHLRLRGGHPA